MNAKEKAMLLRTYNYLMLNGECHGCDDEPRDLWNDWTLEEHQQLVKEYHDWNGDPEEYDPTFLHIGYPGTIFSFLFKKAMKELEKLEADETTIEQAVAEGYVKASKDFVKAIDEQRDEMDTECPNCGYTTRSQVNAVLNKLEDIFK